MISHASQQAATSYTMPFVKEWAAGLVPLTGELAIFLEHHPMQVVLHARAHLINEQLVTGLCDLSHLSHQRAMDMALLFEEGKKYNLQLETTDQSLILFDLESYLETFSFEGKVIFFRFALVHHEPVLFEWLKSKDVINGYDL